MAHDADSDLAELVVFVIRQRLRGSDDDTLTGMDTERVEVLHITDGDTVVVAVTYDLVLDFLPALEALLYEDLRGEGEGLATQFVKLSFVVAEAAAQATESVGGTDDDGVAQLLGCTARIFGCLYGMALDRLDADLIELASEEVTVFRVHNGLDGSTQYLDIVLLEDAALVECYTAVERCLSAEGKEDPLRTLLLDDLLDEEGGDGEEVDLVSDAFGGLYRGDVGVDEYGAYPLFAHGLECL